jgi:hypothetical protein
MTRGELFTKLLAGNKTAKYLEIGVDNPASTFLNVEASMKIAVDPYSDDSNKCHAWGSKTREQYISELEMEATKFYRLTSDEYFAQLDLRTKFDLIFIDGLHTEEQVRKDVVNSLLHLKKGGLIILDDALPNSPLEAVETPKPGAGWRGTVYRFIAEERLRGVLGINLFCNHELNMCVIENKPSEVELYSRDEFPNPVVSFEFYSTFRDALMRVLPLEEFLKKLKV